MNNDLSPIFHKPSSQSEVIIKKGKLTTHDCQQLKKEKGLPQSGHISMNTSYKYIASIFKSEDDISFNLFIDKTNRVKLITFKRSSHQKEEMIILPKYHRRVNDALRVVWRLVLENTPRPVEVSELTKLNKRAKVNRINENKKIT